MTLKSKRFGGCGEERQRGSGVYETRSRKYYAEVKVARVGMRETRSRKYYAEVKVARVGVRETRSLETWFALSSLGKLAEFTPYQLLLMAPDKMNM